MNKQNIRWIGRAALLKVTDLTLTQSAPYKQKNLTTEIGGRVQNALGNKHTVRASLNLDNFIIVSV